MSEIILHLSSGFGPKECEWVIARLAERFAKEAISEGLECQRVDINADTPGSILMRVKGRQSSDFVAARKGSIRWVGASPFRPNHKRKNWYVSVRSLAGVEDMQDLKQADIKYQAVRSSGPGGQHVNKTDSAIRITHLPTGLVVTCQDGKSQHKNKAQAMKVLGVRLYEKERAEVASEEADARKSMVGSGDRSERIRTYNFPQGRVTDHRINLTLHKLPEILEGAMGDMVDALIAQDQAERMAGLNEG